MRHDLVSPIQGIVTRIRPVSISTGIRAFGTRSSGISYPSSQNLIGTAQQREDRYGSSGISRASLYSGGITSISVISCFSSTLARAYVEKYQCVLSHSETRERASCSVMRDSIGRETRRGDAPADATSVPATVGDDE